MDLESFAQADRDWHPKAHRAEGGWRIEADGQALAFRLDADFRTDWCRT